LESPSRLITDIFHSEASRSFVQLLVVREANTTFSFCSCRLTIKVMWKVVVVACCLLNFCESQVKPPCGQRVISGGLINKGSVSKLASWPWLGVWCHGETTAKCFCSVSLITAQHAVTAAHCLYPKDEEATYWPNTALHFGRFDLTDEDEEENSQVRKIVDVAIHDKWNPSGQVDSYDGDIAVLRLNEPVRFSRLVQPVCLPTASEFNGGDSKGFVVSEIKFLDNSNDAGMFSHPSLLLFVTFKFFPFPGI